MSEDLGEAFQKYRNAVRESHRASGGSNEEKAGAEVRDRKRDAKEKGATPEELEIAALQEGVKVAQETGKREKESKLAELLRTARKKTFDAAESN